MSLVTNIATPMQEIFREYFRYSTPPSAQFARILEGASPVGGSPTKYVYDYLGGSVAAPALGTPMSEGDSLPARSLTVTSKQVDLNRYPLGRFTLSDFHAQGFEAVHGHSPVEQFQNRLLSYAANWHGVTVRAEAVAELDVEALDTADASFVDDFAEVCVEIEETGARPNALLLSPAGVARLRKNAKVREYAQITFRVESDAERLESFGHAHADVAAWLESQGIRLFVDGTVGDGGFPLGATEGIIGHVGANTLATLSTFAPSNGDIGRFRAVEGTTAIEDILLGEGYWRVEATAPETGRILTFDGAATVS